jgi:hypothetical protein
MVTRIRDPMDVFWSLLNKRYRLIAEHLYRQSPWMFGSNYEDLAQDILIKTQTFVEERREELGESFAITETFLGECILHGRTCMENRFKDEIRKGVRRRPRSAAYYNDDGTISMGVLGVHDPRNPPDARAIARRWVRQMRSRSKRQGFQRMLTALVELIDEDFPDISIQDVADRAKASHNDVYRFRTLVEDTRVELAAKGQTL